MSKVKEYSAMTKDKLMTYTFVALLILAVVAVVLWWPVTSNSGWNLGLTVAITSLIAVELPWVLMHCSIKLPLTVH